MRYFKEVMVLLWQTLGSTVENPFTASFKCWLSVRTITTFSWVNFWFSLLNLCSDKHINADKEKISSLHFYPMGASPVTSMLCHCSSITAIRTFLLFSSAFMNRIFLIKQPLHRSPFDAMLPTILIHPLDYFWLYEHSEFLCFVLFFVSMIQKDL